MTNPIKCCFKSRPSPTTPAPTRTPNVAWASPSRFDEHKHGESETSGHRAVVLVTGLVLRKADIVLIGCGTVLASFVPVSVLDRCGDECVPPVRAPVQVL